VVNLGAMDAKGRELIVKVVGEINGVVGVFLIDSGATTEFMDEEYAKKAGLSTRLSATRIRLADGVVSKSLGAVDRVHYLLGWSEQSRGGGRSI